MKFKIGKTTVELNNLKILVDYSGEPLDEPTPIAPALSLAMSIIDNIIKTMSEFNDIRIEEDSAFVVVEDNTYWYNVKLSNGQYVSAGFYFNPEKNTDHAVQKTLEASEAESERFTKIPPIFKVGGRVVAYVEIKNPARTRPAEGKELRKHPLCDFFMGD